MHAPRNLSILATTRLSPQVTALHNALWQSVSNPTVENSRGAPESMRCHVQIPAASIATQIFHMDGASLHDAGRALCSMRRI